MLKKFPVKETLRSLIRAFPGAKSVVLPVYAWWSGIPRVTDGEITEAVLRRYIKTDTPLIVEVGANDGSHTEWFKQVFPNAQVHSFEPVSSAQQRFVARTLGLHGVQLHRTAVGRSRGSVKFYPSIAREGSGQVSAWDASGSLREPSGHLNLHPEIVFAQPVEVPCIRLDDWLSEFDPPQIDFLWMDVQGAELDVLAGAEETLKRTKLVYTEYAVQELYRGQPTLKQILSAVPNFRPVIRYINDILLRVAVDR
jgi:FkbM family methyltransferase